MALLNDEIRAWIGKEVSFSARDELSRASIRCFALATGDHNPLYNDDEYARSAGYPSLIAPPTLIVETGQCMNECLDVDGEQFAFEWKLPISNVRTVRAGNDYEFFRPILPTDRISVTWRIDDIVEKASSRGGTQLFVISKGQFFDEKGELIAINRDTQVLQPIKPAA